MENLCLGSEEIQICTCVNYYGEKIADTRIENLTDEEIPEEYQQMTLVQRKFNQLVQFHRDYEKTFGLAGTIHQLIYGQINKQNPMYEEIAEAEMATASEDKHQIEISEENGVRCIIPIKVKEEPFTQYTVIDLTDKEGLPDMPAEAFNQPLKVEYDSYSESDVTDESDYAPDDIPLKETDEEDLADMEDQNISSIDIQQIEIAMKQVSDGLQQATNGYDSIRKCLPTMTPEEIG